MALADQEIAQGRRLLARIGEDQHLLHRTSDEQGIEEGPFVLQVVRQQALVLDVGVGGAVMVGLDPLGVAQGRVDKGLDAGPGQGRREEQGLAVRVAHLDDPHDIGGEAHVQHAVGLVQHQDLQVSQVRRAPLQVIQEPPRRGDEDVRIAAQAGHLLAGGAATHDDPGGEPREAGDLEEMLLDLIGQLPGRHQDQGADALARCRLGQKALHHGQQEGDGFARPGGGGHQQVGPGDGEGDHQPLDRGRFAESQLIQAPRQGLGQIEIGKVSVHGVATYTKPRRLAANRRIWISPPCPARYRRRSRRSSKRRPPGCRRGRRGSSRNRPRRGRWRCRHWRWRPRRRPGRRRTNPR